MTQKEPQNSEQNQEPAEIDSSENQEESADELKDKLMRALADMENMRKRHEKDMAEQRQFGAAQLAQAFLGVADHMDMALESLEGSKKSTAALLKSVTAGIDASKRELLEVLKNFGIEEVMPQVGDGFSYQEHEAVQREPHGEIAEGGIVRVLRKGYRMHDRLLRAAMVVVSAGAPASKETKSKKTKQ